MNSKTKIIASFFSMIIFGLLVFFVFPQNKNANNQIQGKPQEIMAQEYKIGFITDVHGHKSTKKEAGVNKEAAKVLTYFANHMNSDFQPDFVVNGGDLIEGTDREGEKSIEDFKALVQYFEMLDAPAYHLNGNHEMRGFSKGDWLNLTGYEKSYYYIDYKKLRAIFLDGNENEIAIPEIDNYNKDYYYLSEEQFRWLEKIMAESGQFKKLIFIHYPPFEIPGVKIIEPLQSARLRDIFSRYKTAAVFSGHAEILKFEEIDGVKYFVLPGTEKSKHKQVPWLECFAEIYAGKEVKAELFYKKNSAEENYRKLIIPSDEFYRMEK